MSAREEVVNFWDREIQRWVSGDHVLTRDLYDWKESYQGSGLGQVDLDVFPEPYVGAINGAEPRLIMLGLNPGIATPEFQSMEGIFTRQIRESSYSEWASTAPYVSDVWESEKGANVYLRNRLSFAQRLHDEPEIQANQLLFMELYPFHSARVTASMTPPMHLLERFVFEPLAEFDVEHIFAFGKPWSGVAKQLGLSGRPLEVDWRTGSRESTVYPLKSGQNLVVLSQTGYAGPPGVEDTELLRQELGYR